MTIEPSQMRVRPANERSPRPDRAFVLYWMIAARRTRWNHALDRAVDWATRLRKPLLILEALRCDYPWASDRLHQFVIDGMADNCAALEHAPITYYPYLEPARGAGKGLLQALAADAAVVVTDEFPSFFLPRMVHAAAARLDVRLEVVDGNGLLPLAAADHAFTTASHFRRFVQRELVTQARPFPMARPMRGLHLPRLPHPPSDIARRWPAATISALTDPATVGALPIDHTVPVSAWRGGERAAGQRLERFVREHLSRYADEHNHPDAESTSRLSPYLHFGHISAHEIFAAVMRRERWSFATIRGRPATGARTGWWGVGAAAEAFLDQLVVWRELAYNTCAHRPHEYDRFDSLPQWAVATLAAHRRDPRPHRYSRDQLEAAATHDPIWNAAQMQLRREGWCHNYPRMLWGKKILEWSNTPADALETMIQVMNKWSLDGRSPTAYAGYMWTLGRYDRPWPERPIYGKVRAMSSERTRQKINMKRYLRAFGDPLAQDLPLDDGAVSRGICKPVG